MTGFGRGDRAFGLTTLRNLVIQVQRIAASRNLNGVIRLLELIAQEVDGRPMAATEGTAHDQLRIRGRGQALWEGRHYDGETGQMLSATFMEHVLPRADVLPAFTTEISEVPSTSNPPGLRGGGEGGTTPALGAVVNAIVDALAELGVEHIEMPVTPERVWRAIREAKASTRPSIGP